MNDSPVPMTPADCDLRDFGFMPLDVARLRDSDLAAEQTPEENWAALLLWGASWHQVPAASVPNSEQFLAKAAGYMAQGKIAPRWKKIQPGAMRNFVLCSDGRWYHPVVAEKAREAWRSKLAQRLRTECSRIKKHNERHGTKVPYPDFEEWLTAGCPTGQPLPVPGDKPPVSPGQDGVVTGDNGSNRQGEGQGQGTINSSGGAAPPPGPTPAPTPTPGPTPAPSPTPAPAKPPRAPKQPADPAPTAAVWEAFETAYRGLYGVSPLRNAQVNGLLANFVTRVPKDDAPQVAAFYLTVRAYATANHSVKLLVRDAEGLHTRWKTGTREPTQPTTERQRRAQQVMAPFRRESAADDGRTIDMEDGDVRALTHG